MLTFQGGVHPTGYKELSKDKAIKVIKASDILVYPLSQHIGKPAKPVVNIGDRVLVGQIIGEADGFISANVISTVSGNVIKIEDRMTVGGKKCLSIVVANDGKYDKIDGLGKERKLEDLSTEDIVSMVKSAGIVGLGGAAFPTHVKLSPKEPDKIDYVLVNGAECEPYLTSDYRIMMETPEFIVSGLLVILKVFKNAKGIICIEDNKIDAYEKIKSIVEKIGDKRLDVVLLKTKYPQGGERQLIYAVTKRTLNVDKLPADVGCIVDNIDTVVAIANAVLYSTPLMTRIITVVGSAFNESHNFRVTLGTDYNDVVSAAGGFKKEPKKIISGGPMMGLPIWTLDMPIQKNSSCLLAFDSDPKANDKETNCINCGRCVDACPINLLPTRLYKAAKVGDFETYIKLGGLDCISCGCCSYVCPARKPLTPYFTYMRGAARGYINSKKEADNGK